MQIPILRKDIQFFPDPSRVITRFFSNGELHTKSLLQRVMMLDEPQVRFILEQTLREFAGRHRNLFKVFHRHCEQIKPIIERYGIPYDQLTDQRKMLLGAYSTMEYAVEAAALFNPSIVEDPDQTFLEAGEKRVILSFRATGEGHISSVVFRRAILDKENNLRMMKVGKHIEMAEIIHKNLYDKKRFITKMAEMHIPEKYTAGFMDTLPEKFESLTLLNHMDQMLEKEFVSAEQRKAIVEITWLIDSYYDVQFQGDSDLSERVIFPLSASEKNGIEDARFVRLYDEDDHSIKVYATYTAFNGQTILPKLLATEDFYTFRMMPLLGNGAQNKNLALFPRKINGNYAMLARVDGINNFIMYSSRITVWNNPILLQEPEFPWELNHMGNCGSPLWTPEGWLLITHGVGPMRRYCIGVSLLSLSNPTQVIGRLKEPLLIPLEREREGYVPNVVYSCGALIHNDNLILPYAISDYASSYAVISLPVLMEALRNNHL